MVERTRRRMVSIMLAGVVAGTASQAFGQTDKRPRPHSDLESIEFVLEDVRYQILLPRGSRPAAKSEPGCVKIWHPRAVRAMIFLELCSVSRPPEATFAERATLSDRIRVQYTIDHDLGGGSGGTEGELKGELDLEGKVFLLTCRDQDEARNNPEWCLDYLHSLQVKDRK